MNAPVFINGAKPKQARLFAKHPEHWYVEPESVTAGLLGVERFVGPIWDPACGGGNILRACAAEGYKVFGSDIVRRVADDLLPIYAGEHNFLTNDPAKILPAGGIVDIITNPPYFAARGTEDFIRHALRIARGKVAIFTELRFLASERRARGLFAAHPPHRVWHIAKRPSCPPGTYLEAGNKAGGGQADWCWLVWSMTERPAQTYQGGWILPGASS